MTQDYSLHPTWWNDQHNTAWERAREALRRDWEQTKADLTGNASGHDLNQSIGDTVRQATGKDPLPLRVEVFDKGLKSPSRRDYIGWTQALELPDAFFEPDPRVKLERMSYDEYLKRSAEGPVGSVPILFGSLLHGEPTDGAPATTSAPTPR